MARIAVKREMPVPQDRVWAAIADLASHPTWMKDTEWVVFLGDQQRGVGTRLEAKTVVGPLRTVDVMEVVGWDEGEAVEVEHRGLVTGRGILRATTRGEGSLVEWVETLDFPWWLGGPVTAWLARPILAAIWRGNLKRLEATLTSL